MNHVLGFDFGGTKVAIATARLEDGEVIEIEQLDSRAYDNGVDLVTAAIRIGQALCERMVRENPASQLAAIGVSTMGITYPDRVEMAPNVPKWSELRMPDMFRAGFGEYPLLIWNDVKTAALAEIARGALVGVETGMYLNLGTGIAIALTLGDQVVSGAHGAAGEVAYCLLDEYSPQGVQDGAAPFEEFAGGIWIERRATKAFGRPMTPRDVFVSHPEPEVIRFREDLLSKLAFHLTNALVLWDPSHLVIGGGMSAAKDVIFPFLENRFQKFVPYPPEIQQARFGSEAGLVGAIELARLSAKSVSASL